jgi:hypothetical protein
MIRPRTLIAAVIALSSGLFGCGSVVIIADGKSDPGDPGAPPISTDPGHDPASPPQKQPGCQETSASTDQGCYESRTCEGSELWVRCENGLCVCSYRGIFAGGCYADTEGCAIDTGCCANYFFGK